MKLFELADEFHMTSSSAAALCAQLGIHTASAGDEIQPGDAERFRAAAGSAPAGPDDAAAGWASPTSPAAPFAPPAAMPGPAYQAAVPGSPGPAGAPVGRGAVDPADLARLAEARKRANNVIVQGFGLIALCIVITVGTVVLAPGGLFIISIGTFIGGVRRISAGRKMQARIRQAERQLGR